MQPFEMQRSFWPEQVHQARVAHGMNRTLRHAKRYLVDDSPLTAISWWRIMLDEAQNVGDGFSQVHQQAEGTLWATPLQRCLWCRVKARAN